MIKLKQNQTFHALGNLFSIHRTTAKEIFVEVLDAMYSSTKDLLFWPSRNTIQERMPASFKTDFPNCRCIIDATEVKIEKPSRVDQEILTYSNYKGTFTLKFLVAIAPHGEIIFVSRGYGGRATDAQITTSCGLLDLLEPGDVILADKGLKTNFNPSLITIFAA
jgi:hypothetical protein